MRSELLRRRGALVAIFVVLAVIPAFGVGSYDLFRLELVLLYAAAAMGMSLVVGFSGELLLSQPAVIAVAAYATALVDLHLGWEPVLIIPVAIGAGVAVGIVTGSPGLRIGGLYLGIISFFAVAILADVSVLTKEWSGGEAGLSGISTFRVLGLDDRWLSFEVALLIALFTYLMLRRLVGSGFGLRLTALRDAPRALQSSGVSITATKVSVYAAAAVPGALVGWLFPYVNRSVGTQFFGLSFTLLLLASVELSGRGTLLGTAIAAALLQTYSLTVGPFSEYNEIGLGAVLLVAILLFPRGLAGVLPAKVRRTLFGAPPAGPEHGSDEVAEPPIARGEAPVLEVEGVSRSFGGNRALTDVSLQLTPGRVLGLIGGNGSGKTTLINAVTGHLRPDTGVVRVSGEDVTALRPEEIAARGVSRTFQLPQLISGTSVRRNVEVGLLGTVSRSWLSTLLRPRTADRTDVERAVRASRAIRLIDPAEGFGDQPVDTLPLGMKRVVEVARVLAGGAQIVLLDEPASGLSDVELVRLGAILAELKRRGHAVLFVEHNLSFVMDHCDEIVLLAEGRVVARHDNHSGNPHPPELQSYLQHVPSLHRTDETEVAR